MSKFKCLLFTSVMIQWVSAWLLFTYYLAHFNRIFRVTSSLFKHDRLCHNVQSMLDAQPQWYLNARLTWEGVRMNAAPSWSCVAGSPALCGGCPGTLGSACWGQSQCPSIWGTEHEMRSGSSTCSRTSTTKTEAGSYFLQWMAGCFLLGSPIRIQCSISLVGRGALQATRYKPPRFNWSAIVSQ